MALRAYSPDLIAEMRRLYSEEGKGVVAIARLLRVGKSGVSYVLRNLLPPRSNRRYATREEALAARPKGTCACGQPMKIESAQCLACLRSTQKAARAAAGRETRPSAPKPKQEAPVVQGENGGLISPRPEVRVLPGVSALEAAMSQPDAPCRHVRLIPTPNGKPIEVSTCKLCGAQQEEMVIWWEDAEKHERPDGRQGGAGFMGMSQASRAKGAEATRERHRRGKEASHEPTSPKEGPNADG